MKAEDLKDWRDMLSTGEEVIFETESKEKEGHYIDLYVEDGDASRKLLSSKEVDIYNIAKEAGLAGYSEEGGYTLDFYAEYYPYTDKIAVKLVLEIDTFGVDITEKALSGFAEAFDKVGDDMYIKLTPEEEELVKTAVKDYINEHGYLDDFYEFEEDAAKDME